MNNKHKTNEDFINQKIDKNSGFIVPDDYMASLENKISSQVTREDILKKTGFSIPETYFSNLEDEISSKITRQKKRRVIPLKNIIPYVSAASVLLIIGVFVFSNSQNSAIENISVTDIEAWYENGYSATLASEIGMILDTYNLEEMDFNIQNISEQDLNNYIDLTENTSIFLEIEN